MKISGNYRFYRGFVEGGESPLAEKWAFLSRRLNFRVGGEIKRKINSFRIIRQGRGRSNLPLKFSKYEKNYHLFNIYFILLKRI
jgi:hypothetical protein